MVQILETRKFAGNIALYTIDVKSLYTNIPVDHAIQLIREFLKKYPLEHGDFILECMEFVLKNNIMKFKNQIFGIAMGTPLAPVLANMCNRMTFQMKL